MQGNVSFKGSLKQEPTGAHALTPWGPPETRHIHIEQHKIEENVVEVPHWRFTGFISNDVMALPRRPYRSTESPIQSSSYTRMTDCMG